MKNYLLLLVAFLSLNLASVAQNFEGKITMKMEALDLSPEMESMKSMFDNTITTYSKGNKSRTESTSPMTGSMIIITDMEKKEVVMCMDMMGQKTAVVSPMEDYKEMQKQNPAAKMKFEPTSETKTVAGHVCKKSISSIEQDGKKITLEFWCATDIQNTNADYMELPGLPLEYSMKSPMFTMHFIATEIIKQSVDNSMFEIPAGYTKKTAEEFKKQMSGAGGH
jgi:GLPGLI family protein